MDRKRKRAKASLTVEAALVLPVFLFGILFFLYYFQILFLQDSIQRALTETGKFISRYEKIWEEKEIPSLVEKVALKQRFLSYLDKENINASCIFGGVGGISLALSEITEAEEKIDMIAVYQIQIYVPFFGKKSVLARQRFLTRAFTGKLMKGQEGEASSGEGKPQEDFLVYVAENGSVYHVHEQCTHLKLSITQIKGGALELARNENGGKYKPCEKCIGSRGKEDMQEGGYYIAKEGDRYHLSTACSGLKRTVYAVYYSSIGDKRKCKRCG